MSWMSGSPRIPAPPGAARGARVAAQSEGKTDYRTTYALVYEHQASKPAAARVNFFAWVWPPARTRTPA